MGRGTCYTHRPEDQSLISRPAEIPVLYRCCINSAQVRSLYLNACLHYGRRRLIPIKEQPVVIHSLLLPD